MDDDNVQPVAMDAVSGSGRKIKAFPRDEVTNRVTRMLEGLSTQPLSHPETWKTWSREDGYLQKEKVENSWEQFNKCEYWGDICLWCLPSTKQQGFLQELGEVMNVMEGMMKLEDMIMAVFWSTSWYWSTIYEESVVEEMLSISEGFIDLPWGIFIF